MEIHDKEIRELCESVLKVFKESAIEVPDSEIEVEPEHKGPIHINDPLNVKDDLHHHLTQTKEVGLDHFANNEDIINFIDFISNLHNITNLNDKKELLVILRKYKEILELLVTAIPFIKKKCGDFGIQMPNLVESENLKSKIRKIFNE